MSSERRGGAASPSRRTPPRLQVAMETILSGAVWDLSTCLIIMIIILFLLNPIIILNIFNPHILKFLSSLFYSVLIFILVKSLKSKVYPKIILFACSYDQLHGWPQQQPGGGVRLRGRVLQRGGQAQDSRGLHDGHHVLHHRARLPAQPRGRGTGGGRGHCLRGGL